MALDAEAPEHDQRRCEGQTDAWPGERPHAEAEIDPMSGGKQTYLH
jgi:hypothetical protein